MAWARAVSRCIAAPRPTSIFRRNKLPSYSFCKPGHHVGRSAGCFVLAALATAFGVVNSASANGGSATWLVAPKNGAWMPNGSNANWSSGGGNFPGTAGTTTNTDVATFLTSNTTTISQNVSTLNLESIEFGVSGSTPSAFTLGTTAGNAFLLSSGGHVSILSGVTGSVTETINAPIVLEPATSSTAGAYTFSNNSSSDLLNFGGGITGGTTSSSVTLTLSGSNTGNNTVSGAIGNGAASGGVTVTKSGTGTWVLTGTNAYTAGTAVGGATNGGTLLVNNTTGSGTGTGNVTVNGSGTTLGGTGTISGQVMVGNTTPGAIINPGPSGANGTSASVGTLTTGALTLTGADTFHADAFGTPTADWDKLISTGAINLGTALSTLQVSIASGLTFTPNTVYTLLSGTSLSGTFAGITNNQLVTESGYEFIAQYTSTGFDLEAVPEPSTWVAGALALGAVGYMQLRRRSRAGSRSPARDESPSDPPNFTSSLAIGISLNNRLSVTSYRLPGVASQTSDVRGYTS